MDETDKLAYGIVWKSLRALEGDISLDKLSDIANYGRAQIPNLNPALQILCASFDYVFGFNPTDAHTNALL
jgi:hypothetical protein